MHMRVCLALAVPPALLGAAQAQPVIQYKVIAKTGDRLPLAASGTPTATLDDLPVSSIGNPFSLRTRPSIGPDGTIAFLGGWEVESGANTARGEALWKASAASNFAISFLAAGSVVDPNSIVTPGIEVCEIPFTGHVDGSGNVFTVLDVDPNEPVTRDGEVWADFDGTFAAVGAAGDMLRRGYPKNADPGYFRLAVHPDGRFITNERDIPAPTVFRDTVRYATPNSGGPGFTVTTLYDETQSDPDGDDYEDFYMFALSGGAGGTPVVSYLTDGGEAGIIADQSGVTIRIAGSTDLEAS